MWGRKGEMDGERESDGGCIRTTEVVLILLRCVGGQMDWWFKKKKEEQISKTGLMKETADKTRSLSALPVMHWYRYIDHRSSSQWLFRVTVTLCWPPAPEGLIYVGQELYLCSGVYVWLYSNFYEYFFGWSCSPCACMGLCVLDPHIMKNRCSALLWQYDSRQ